MPQKAFADTGKGGRVQLLASSDERDGSFTIHQDAGVYATLLAQGERATHALGPGRHAWVQVARGEVDFGGPASKRATARPSRASVSSC